MRLSELAIYPVKSCAPTSLGSGEVEPRGLVGDRRWMVVDPDGCFITARVEPRMLQIRPQLTGAGLVLSAPGMPTLTVRPPGADRAASVRVWKDQVEANTASEEAHRWLSRFLARECRLVFQAGHQREIDSRPGGRPGDQVSFADGYPLLLIGTASLVELNRRLARPVPMQRFRPNLVVATQRPHEEDDWASVRIGPCEFTMAKTCTRCVLTTIDPATAERDPDREPLTTLRSYRESAAGDGILFGVNLIPRRLGRLELGMPVQASGS